MASSLNSSFLSLSEILLSVHPAVGIIAGGCAVQKAEGNTTIVELFLFLSSLQKSKKLKISRYKLRLRAERACSLFPFQAQPCGVCSATTIRHISSAPSLFRIP